MRAISREAFIDRVRSEASLAELDLREADPFLLDLSGRDLRNADLSRRRLPYATGGNVWAGVSDPARKSIRRVRLRGSDLSGARLDRILGARRRLHGGDAAATPASSKRICRKPSSRWLT